MSRLPQVNGDKGNWGKILNTWLKHIAGYRGVAPARPASGSLPAGVAINGNGYDTTDQYQSENSGLNFHHDFPANVPTGFTFIHTLHNRIYRKEDNGWAILLEGVPSSNLDWSLTGNAGTNPNSNFLGTTDNQPLVIRTNNTERVRIDTNGNVGIGIATPTQRLDVNGNVRFSGALMPNGNPGTAGQVLVSQGPGNAPVWQTLNLNQGDQDWLVAQNNQGAGGPGAFNQIPTNLDQWIYTNGNVGIGTAGPTTRLDIAGGALVVKPSTFGTYRTGEGQIAVAGSGSGLFFAKRTLTSWTSAAGNEYAWYNPDGTARLWTPTTGDLITVTSTGNVGIGTTDPSGKLGVLGSAWDFGLDTGVHPEIGRLWYKSDGTGYGLSIGRKASSDNSYSDYVYIRDGGNVGIGTTDPQAKLHLFDTQANGSPNSLIRLGNDGVINTWANEIQLASNAYKMSNVLYLIDTSKPVWALSLRSDPNTNRDDFMIWRAAPTTGTPSWTNYFKIDANGNVGIGTTAPLTTLHTAYSSNSIQRGIISGNYINSSTGGKIFVLKGRGTVASPQPVLAGDQLGVFAFGGYFGTNVSDFTDQAAIIAITTENWNSTSRGCMLRFSTTSNGSSTSQPRVTIDQDGNVGIGTTTPGAKLQIAGGAVRLDAPQGAPYGYSIRIGSGWGGWARAYGFHSSADAELAAFGAYGSGNTLTYAFIGPGATAHNNPWMVITNTGNVGIGTTNPGHKLHVIGNVFATGVVYCNSSALCSDQRWKTNIKPIQNALDNVLKIQGVTYNWKIDEYPDKHFSKDEQIGFIAQEIEKIYPQVVLTDKDGYKSIDYSKLTPILVEAIKDQQKVIQELQAENAQTKSELKALAEKMNILINTLSAEKKVGNK